jgi:hypothetical protein
MYYVLFSPYHMIYRKLDCTIVLVMRKLDCII